MYFPKSTERRAEHLAWLASQPKEKDNFVELVSGVRTTAVRYGFIAAACFVLPAVGLPVWLQLLVWAVGLLAILRISFALLGYNKSLSYELDWAERTDTREWKALNWADAGAAGLMVTWFFGIPTPGAPEKVKAFLTLLWILGFAVAAFGIGVAELYRSKERIERSKSVGSAA